MSCDAGTPERKPLGAQASDGSGSGALAFAALLLVALCATPGSSAGEVDTALKRDSIDVFIGETRMAPHARRLGVHYWTMHPCGPDAEPASRVAAGASGEAPRAGGQP